jgi:hypothetical protein
MEHQQKEDRKPIGKIIQEKKSRTSFTDSRIRISKDFTFYGITQTKGGDPEISLGLKIIKANGEQYIIQYHELISPIHYDGATTIKLLTPSISITITGKNLDDVIDYLAEHRLMWIKEPDSDFVEVKEGEVEISSIVIKDN